MMRAFGKILFGTGFLLGFGLLISFNDMALSKKEMTNILVMLLMLMTIGVALIEASWKK